MTKRKKWPEHAEGARMDVIALASECRSLLLRLDEANACGDRGEVSKLTARLWELMGRIDAHMKGAAR